MDHTSWTESDRLAALDRYHVLDTEPEKDFDDVVRLTAELLDAPIAAVNLIARERQWFKSEVGLGVREMPLDDSICRHALFSADRMVVPDTTLDDRFQRNPLVTGGPGLRFYAGELLKTPDGMPLGTLCVLDTTPRPAGLTPQQEFALQTLARQIMAQLELRRLVVEQDALLRDNRRTVEALRRERDRAHQLFQGMDEGFVFLDPQYRIREISPGGLRMDGRTAQEIVGRTHWDAWPGSEELPVADAIRQAMVSRVPANLEQFYEFPDGRTFWLDMRAFPAEGGIAMFYRDITQRKEAERKLRQSEQQARNAAREAEQERQRLDAVLDAAPVAIMVADAAGRIMRVNAENRKLWGDSPPTAQEVGEYAPWRGWWTDGSPQAGQPLAPGDWAMARALGGEERPRQVIEIAPFNAPEERRTILNSGAPIRDAAGAIVGSVVAQMDITDRVKAEKALREADQRKDEFLAMLAHELRNPLAPIMSAAHLLTSDRLDSRRAPAIAAIISRQARHMTTLVDDLLDVSRVTRGLIKLEKEPVDAKAVIASAVEQAKPLLETHGHALSLHLASEAGMVDGDRERLVQIVANLLNNAAKYTPHGGSIAISLEVQETVLTIAVRDNGIGMSKELIGRVFELFTQAERTPDRKQGGLGIGLALVRSLALLHGGSVKAHSDGPGKGSTFTVTLPRKVLPASAAGAAEGSAEPRQRTAAPLRVQIVDDNEDAAETLGAFLEMEGHEVCVAHSAKVAIERAPAFRPDVAILDIGMPEMDGYALARHLRGMPETANAMMVALTGYGQEGDRGQALAAGFDHHLVKPVDVDRLQQLLQGISRYRRTPAHDGRDGGG